MQSVVVVDSEEASVSAMKHSPSCMRRDDIEHGRSPSKTWARSATPS